MANCERRNKEWVDIIISIIVLFLLIWIASLKS